MNDTSAGSVETLADDELRLQRIQSLALDAASGTGQAAATAMARLLEQVGHSLGQLHSFLIAEQKRTPQRSLLAARADAQIRALVQAAQQASRGAMSTSAEVSGRPASAPRVLVVVDGGVAACVGDEGVEVVVFDKDDFRDDPANYDLAPEHFADLAQRAGVPFGRPVEQSQREGQGG